MYTYFILVRTSGERQIQFKMLHMAISNSHSQTMNNSCNSRKIFSTSFFIQE